MELKVADIVTVQRKGCCHGHERGVECQIIDTWANPESGKILYLCFPEPGQEQEKQGGQWHCARCLKKKETEAPKDGNVNS